MGGLGGGLKLQFDQHIIPTALRSSILHKLYAAHGGPDFTFGHARNTVFWPGLTPQVKDIHTNYPTCAQHMQQHPQEPLQPYPMPTLPWQPVSQDLFKLKGWVYLVTVDHYSDYHEVDHLPTTQSMAAIQATKQHFGRHDIPHIFITDNGPQYTSDLLKVFTQKY